MKKLWMVFFLFFVCMIVVKSEVYAQKEVVITNTAYKVKIEDSDKKLKRALSSFSHVSVVESGYDLILILNKETKEFRKLIHRKGESYTKRIQVPTGRSDPFTGVMIFETKVQTGVYAEDKYKIESVSVYYYMSVKRADGTIIAEKVGSLSSDEDIKQELQYYLAKTIRIKLNTIDILNNVMACEKIIAAGQNVNERVGELQETMLIAAVKKNDAKLVQILIQNGADVNISDIKGWTPYFYAIGSANNQIAEVLKKNGANINHTDKDGNTVAVAEGRYNTTQLVAAIKKADIDAMKLYLNKNVMLYEKSNDGIFPFDAACGSGSSLTLKLLFEYGFDFSKGKGFLTENSALIPLYRQGRYDDMEELLKRGYVVFKGSADKESVMDIVVKEGIVAKEGNVKIITMLREYGAKAPNTDDSYILVSILNLAQKGHTGLAKSLMAEAKPSMERIFYTVHEWAPKEFIYWILENMPFDIPKADISSFSFCIKNAKKNPDPSLYSDLTTNLDVIQKYSQKMYIGEKLAFIACVIFESKDTKKINQMLQMPQFVNNSLYDPRLEDQDATWYKKTHRSVDSGQELRLIHLAAYYGNSDAVQKLLMKDPMLVLASDSKGSGFTPLDFAIMGGDTATVKFVLEKSILASKNKQYEASATTMRLAFESKNQDIIDAVLSKISSMQTLLKSAIHADNAEMVRLAIEKGADPLVSVEGNDALDLARILGKWKAAYVLLEMKGASFSMFVKPEKVKYSIRPLFEKADFAVVKKVVELLTTEECNIKMDNPIWDLYNTRKLTDEFLLLFLQKGADPTKKYGEKGGFEEFCKKYGKTDEKLKKWYDIIQAHKKKK